MEEECKAASVASQQHPRVTTAKGWSQLKADSTRGRKQEVRKRDEQGRTKKPQRWQEHTGRTKLATSCVIHGGVFRKQLNSNTYNSETLTVPKYLHRKKVVKNAGAEKDL